MPEQNFDDTIISSGNNPFNIKLLLVFIVILLLAGVGMGYYLYSKGVINLPFLSNFILVPPADSRYETIEEVKEAITNTQPDELLDTCEVTNENNPLVMGLDEVGNLKVGRFFGNISMIEYDEKNNSAIFELISKGATQKHTFNVKDNGLLVFDTEGKNISLGELKPAEFVTMDFSCLPNQENDQFRITQIRLSPR